MKTQLGGHGSRSLPSGLAGDGSGSLNIMANTARSLFCFFSARLAPALLAGALCFGSLSGSAAPIPQAANPASGSQAIRIAGISPSAAAALAAGGIPFPVEVVISGQNFRPGGMVMIGSQAASIVSISDTEIHVTIPGEAAGMMDITVTNPDGTSATLPKAFTYTTGPVVYEVSPATGSATEPTVVTIAGGNLRADSAIKIGGLTATIQFLFSATSLEVQVPANPAVDAGGKMSAALTVSNPDGQTSTLPNAFTWTREPSSSPAPAAAPSATSSPRAATP